MLEWEKVRKRRWKETSACSSLYSPTFNHFINRYNWKFENNSCITARSEQLWVTVSDICFQFTGTRCKIKRHDLRRRTFDRYASAPANVSLTFNSEAMTFKNSSAIPTHTMIICGTFHRNPSTKYRNIASREIGVNARTAGRTTRKRGALCILSKVEAKKLKA